MSIVAPPPNPDPPRGSRTGEDATAGSYLSSEVLLPPGDPPSPAPASTPRRALALDALHMLRRLGGTAAWDPAWDEPSFIRQVESIRRQLGPIRSRSALADSFGREAFHVRRPVLEPDGGTTGPVGPVRLAYAIRWVELGDGEARPAWTAGTTRRGRGRGGRARPRRRPPGASRPRR